MADRPGSRSSSSGRRAIAVRTSPSANRRDTLGQRALDLDDDISRSKLLTQVLGVGLVLVPVAACGLAALRGPSGVETGGLGALWLACLGGTSLLRYGRVKEASWLVISVAALFVLAIAATQGGAASPATGGALVIVALASMFLGVRGAVAFTVGAVAMGVGFEGLHRLGWLPWRSTPCSSSRCCSTSSSTPATRSPAAGDWTSRPAW